LLKTRVMCAKRLTNHLLPNMPSPDDSTQTYGDDDDDDDDEDVALVAPPPAPVQEASVPPAREPGRMLEQILETVLSVQQEVRELHAVQSAYENNLAVHAEEEAMSRARHDISLAQLLQQAARARSATENASVARATVSRLLQGSSPPPLQPHVPPSRSHTSTPRPPVPPPASAAPRRPRDYDEDDVVDDFFEEEVDDDDDEKENDPRRGGGGCSSSQMSAASSSSAQSPGRNRATKKWWTDQEVSALYAGVEQFGAGNWKQILEWDASEVGTGLLAGRTNVDLKDKWANLTHNDSRQKKKRG
jgi:hypothetical protein